MMKTLLMMIWLFLLDGICETCEYIDGEWTIVDNDEDNDGVCNDDENLDVTTPLYVTYYRRTNPDVCIYIADNCDYCSGQIDGTGFVKWDR